jgi:hypothetical protein
VSRSAISVASVSADRALKDPLSARGIAKGVRGRKREWGMRGVRGLEVGDAGVVSRSTGKLWYRGARVEAKLGAGGFVWTDLVGRANLERGWVLVLFLARAT